MSLTVTLPQTGDPFGPGFRVAVSTDLIGPLPPDSFWEFSLEAEPEETNLGVLVVRNPSHTIGAIWLNRGGEFTNPIWAQPDWLTGHAATLRVRLFEDETTVVEDTTVSVVLDRETGQVYEITQFIKDWIPALAAPTGTEDHETIQAIGANMAFLSGFPPLELVGELVQAIATHNPLGYGSLSEIFTLTGDGEMPDPDPIILKWGIYWLASTIPAGLSHKHGQSEEYPARLIQWRTVHEVGGTEMVTELLDAQTHGELWRFQQQRPRRVEYSIIPGVVIQAQWWQFP